MLGRQKATPASATRPERNARQLPRRAERNAHAIRIGERLAELIRDKGWSQKQLAERLDAWEIESGRRDRPRDQPPVALVGKHLHGLQKPSAATLSAYAVILGVSLDWLVTGTGHVYSDQPLDRRTLAADFTALLRQRLLDRLPDSVAARIRANELDIDFDRAVEDLVTLYSELVQRQFKKVEAMRAAYNSEKEGAARLRSRLRPRFSNDGEEALYDALSSNSELIQDASLESRYLERVLATSVDAVSLNSEAINRLFLRAGTD